MRIIAPALQPLNIFSFVQIVQTSRKHGVKSRGGLVSYEKLRNDILLRMRNDRNPEAWFTTMIDLYGLPPDVPGHAQCKHFPSPLDRVQCIEEHLSSDIVAHLGSESNACRFIPYVQLHEFEALLFSDIEKLTTSFPDSGTAIGDLMAIQKTFEGPEDIDGGADTHPSKRLHNAIRGYDKRVHGIQAAGQIGLKRIRDACPHFNNWVTRLETLK